MDCAFGSRSMVNNTVLPADVPPLPCLCLYPISHSRYSVLRRGFLPLRSVHTIIAMTFVVCGAVRRGGNSWF